MAKHHVVRSGSKPVHHLVPKKSGSKPVHHVVPKKHVPRKPGGIVPDALVGPKMKKTKPAKPPGKPVESATRTVHLHHTIPGKKKAKESGIGNAVKSVWKGLKKKLGFK